MTDLHRNQLTSYIFNLHSSLRNNNIWDDDIDDTDDNVDTNDDDIDSDEYMKNESATDDDDATDDDEVNNIDEDEDDATIELEKYIQVNVIINESD